MSGIDVAGLGFIALIIAGMACGAGAQLIAEGHKKSAGAAFTVAALFAVPVLVRLWLALVLG